MDSIEATIRRAYEAYDADPRAHGREDYMAFRQALQQALLDSGLIGDEDLEEDEEIE